MRNPTIALAVSLAIASAGSAFACGADKSTKVDTKQQTASSQTVKTDQAKKKGS